VRRFDFWSVRWSQPSQGHANILWHDNQIHAVEEDIDREASAPFSALFYRHMLRSVTIKIDFSWITPRAVPHGASESVRWPGRLFVTLQMKV
jgi:hypothetical protein